MLTYEATHKIANFILRRENYLNQDVVGATMERIAKPIKFSELPIAHILSYVRMRGINDKGKEESVIMFHYLNQLKLYFMKSGKIKKPPERKLYRRNIIQFRDRVFVWEDRGRVIERITSPIAKEEKNFLYKAYDAKNVIKLCKKVEYLPNKECLLVSDEDKYVKILSYDDNNQKFKVEKEFFVNNYFGSDTISNLSAY